MNFFSAIFLFYPFHRLERKGGRCCGRPFIDLYSPLPFVSHPPLRSTRDGYLLNARVPFVPAVYEQLRTTSTKFHVSLDQIEFARPRKRPSRSQSPVPSILTSLPETRLSNTLLRNIYPSYLFQYSCVYIYIYIFHSPSNSVNRDIFSWKLFPVIFSYETWKLLFPLRSERKRLFLRASLFLFTVFVTYNPTIQS